MATRSRALLRKGQDQGFTLIELLIVILIVGILAAVATPLYLGYVKDAKTAEAKAIAGSLWTAAQSNAMARCDNNTDVKDAYPKAGFAADGTTSPARWSVTQAISNLKVTCATGAITPDATVFEIDGVAADVSFIKVQLVYNSGNTPPSKLRCDTGGGFVDC
jgi:prepilin-type N-terminal cleavage/methylation domain-containing protein